MKKIIAGNWKFNKELRNAEQAVNFVAALEKKIERFNNVEVKIFPHNSVLPELVKRAKRIKIGSQDIHWEEDGSFTGAHLSPQDLISLGIKETLLGHSETRFYFGATEEKIALKLKAAFKNGIFPTICLGEDIEEKEAGKTKEVLERQIKEGILPACNALPARQPYGSHGGEHSNAGRPALKEFKPESSFFALAYEPVYAIAGFAKLRGMEPKPPKIEDIKYADGIIREIFSKNGYSEIKILYGGSSNPKNARELLTQPFIDGLLPGTASWDLDSFFEMIKIAEEI